MLESILICVLTFSSDKQIGIESCLQREDANIEFFFDQKPQRALGSLGASRIGIEIDHHLFAESRQQPRLRPGKRGPRTRDYVVKSCGKQRNAIHLPFNQDCVIQRTYRFFCEIEIEQHPRLRVDRRLR